MITRFTTACTNLAFQAVNAPSRLAVDHLAVLDIHYGERKDQRLDLYIPATKSTDRHQLIVFFYGGSWTKGARANYYFVAETFTAAGYTVAIPDYIKYPEGAFPTFVEDAAESIRWLANHVDEYTDINDIILMGHSAGAHISAMLIADQRFLDTVGVDRDLISAFVGLAGPYTFKPDSDHFREVFGNLEDFSAMRPATFADGTEPPMLLVHGESDTTVLPIQTERFADRVNEHGGQAQAAIYPGVGHMGPVLTLSRLPFQNQKMRRDVLDFLGQKVPVA
ncbi:MAG: alpha/beta hydrolase [Pseudomonadota bacterium]